MTSKPLIHLTQITDLFSSALGRAMDQVPSLHPGQIEGLHTFMCRIKMQVDSAVSTLAAYKAQNAATQPAVTKSPCGSH